LKTEINKNTIQ